MTLSDCTKADLLWIIKRMCGFMINGGEYELNLALSDLSYKKDKQRLNEAERQANISAGSREEYLQLLKPYEGMRLLDIPEEVLKRADAAIKRAWEADKKWNKLMGIKED